MSLGDSHLHSERLRTAGELVLDSAAAAHAYAWLFKHEPATVEEYVDAVGVNDRQATLATNRLQAHGVLQETDDGMLVEVIDETVGDVRVTPGVAAVLAMQLENWDARMFVQRHGTRTLAAAVAYWPLVRDGEIDAREVGTDMGIGDLDGVEAMNFVRGVEDYLEIDPCLAGLETPDI